MCVHNVWLDAPINSIRIQDMCFEILFVNKLGKTEDCSHQITGKCFNQIISKLNSFQTKKSAFDGTKNIFSMHAMLCLVLMMTIMIIVPRIIRLKACLHYLFLMEVFFEKKHFLLSFWSKSPTAHFSKSLIVFTVCSIFWLKM